MSVGWSVGRSVDDDDNDKGNTDEIATMIMENGMGFLSVGIACCIISRPVNKNNTAPPPTHTRARLRAIVSLLSTLASFRCAAIKIHCDKCYCRTFSFLGQSDMVEV